MNDQFGKLVSWIFGILVLMIGTVNVFWGNDTGFGIFIILLALLYFPPFSEMLKKRLNIKIHYLIKIILGVLVLWAAMGVGELPEKISMMREDLNF